VAKHLLNPNQTPNDDKNMGWSYSMRSENREMFFLYFEEGCNKPILTETIPKAEYEFNWFNPKNGEWIKSGKLQSDGRGSLKFPDFPGGGSVSNTDWALKIKAE
jgi:hypothetical protein